MGQPPAAAYPGGIVCWTPFIGNTTPILYHMTELDFQSRPELARGIRLQIRPTSGEPMLLSPEGITELNPTAHEIVLLCDGKRTVEALIESLAAEFEVSLQDLRADVVSCLDQLEKRNLIVLTR